MANGLMGSLFTGSTTFPVLGMEACGWQVYLVDVDGGHDKAGLGVDASRQVVQSLLELVFLLWMPWVYVL